MDDGVHLSLRDDLGTADVVQRRDDIDTDDTFDARLGREQAHEATTEVAGHASHQNHIRHEPPSLAAVVSPPPGFENDPSQSGTKARHHRDGPRMKRALLLVATLVTRLAQQLAVLLLRHALAALLDD